MTRSQCAQADRGDEILLYDIEDLPPQRRIKHRVRQRKRKDLIRAKRCIVAIFSIDDIIEITARVIPEATVERFVGSLCEIVVASGFDVAEFFAHPAFCQSQRVVPKRIDFDRLAASRGYYPIADLRIHPGELVALLSLRQ